MSLVDPKRKMSKSDEPKSCIFLFDAPEDITKKPGISNLLTIYSLLTGKTTQQLEKEFVDKNYGEFKKALAEVVVNYLEPFRRKQKELLTREVYVQEILKQGASKASTIAKATMQEVKEKMGLF